MGASVVVDATRHAPGLLSRMAAMVDVHASRRWALDPKQERAVLDELVAAVLPYIDAGGEYGRALTASDFLYCSVGMERGAPFPMIHTDTEWDLFPACDGFQLWYLVAPDSTRPTEANMLLVDAASSSGADPPTAYYFQPGGGVLQARNDGTDAPPEDKERLATHASLDACGLTFRRLDVRAGTCVLMNRHQLHMSDPRPHLAGRSVDRLAVSMRVVLKPPPAGAGAGAGEQHRTAAGMVDAHAPSYAGKALPRML